MARRLLSLESLLLTGSVFLLALACWPPGPTRQSVYFRSSEGELIHRRFEVDSPSLATYRSRLKTWATPPPAPESLAVAKWRRELCDFYASELAEAEPTVVQVSFTDSQPAVIAPRKPPTASAPQAPSSPDYWRDQSKLAGAAIDSHQALLTARSETRLPPIVFGKLTSGQRPRMAIPTSAGCALLVAVMFAIWGQRDPVVKLGPCDIQSTPIPDGHASPDDLSEAHRLSVVVPRDWVRVRQSFGVRIRQILFLALVLWGLWTGLG